jgi:POT family proton-dependent oligopeptide transporter
MSTVAVSEPQTTLKSEGAPEPKGHPKGLYLLFFTEMWERLSYYGMRALLMPYMVTFLLWQPSEASGVYKWYTSLVYLTPLIGGFLADRLIGLRRSIVIGAILMAIGQFLLAFQSLFFPGLAFLIAGNGFFKPNISTMVGKMYKPGDQRRDRAFTIFYMGINLGAFLAPLVCGTLRAKYGFRYGFMAAGVGMILGLIIFLSGQKRVAADVAAAGNDLEVAAKKSSDTNGAPKEDADEKVPGAGGVAGVLSKLWPIIMLTVALAAPGWYVFLFIKKQVGISEIVMPVAFGFVFAWMGTTLMRIRGASKDKSIVIFILFCAAVLFWMAFEQAGNALNLWAFIHTDLHVGSFEYPAEWFQSVNAILIVVLAPLFSIMWGKLAAKNREPSTPLKMVIALGFLALSFVAMVGAGIQENATVSSVPLAEPPKGIDIASLNAGRLSYDASAKELRVRGVFPDFAVMDAMKKSIDPEYAKALDAAEKQSKNASDAHPVTVTIEKLPEGFAFPVDDEEAQKMEMTVDRAKGEASGKPCKKGEECSKMEISWSKDKATVKFTGSMSATAKANLIGAGAPPEWRDPLRQLAKKSVAARVSGLWLWLSYLLATIGELCLSPVGLSMVTKLAPARFASLFMGVWLLASSVAQYVGGAIGESWGKIPPIDYFWLFVWTSVAGLVVLALLVRPLRRLMHNVK